MRRTGTAPCGRCGGSARRTCTGEAEDGEGQGGEAMGPSRSLSMEMVSCMSSVAHPCAQRCAKVPEGGRLAVSKIARIKGTWQQSDRVAQHPVSPCNPHLPCISYGLDGSAKQVGGWWQAGYGVWFGDGAGRNFSAPVPTAERQSVSQAELRGVLHALQHRRGAERLIIILDSEYV